MQHGGAACHEGYHSCYYRRLLPDGTTEIVAERVFDPAAVYQKLQTARATSKQEFLIDKQTISTEVQSKLESALRQLYGVYLYLRDHDLSEESNTSRLLQERSKSYLVARLADELQELADVQCGEHVHSGRQPDTILEGSQVAYWLFLIATTHNLRYDDFAPHDFVFHGYYEQQTEAKAIEQQQDCLNLLSTDQPTTVIQGLQLGFAFIGWACAEAKVSPLEPAEFDLEQMRRKGLAK